MANGWTKPRINQWMIALSVIRPVNLLFIGLTQYLLLFHFLFPLLESAGAEALLSGWRAWAFLLATTSAAAAGYAINDYYDLSGDRINKPRKWLLGKEAHLSHAKALALAATSLGALLSAWIAWDIRAPHLWVLYPLAVYLLWAYSRYLKALPLAGNLLIAALCAMVAGIVWFAEREGFSQVSILRPGLAQEAAASLIFYLGFAFLANLFREIVKDCEDIKGDAIMRKKTLPAALGLEKARWVAFSLGLVLLLVLLAVSAHMLLHSNWQGGVFSSLLLAVPLGRGLYLLAKAKDPNSYTPVSRWAKWVIFAGVFLILFLL